MCYLFHGLSITLMHGRMQYALTKTKSTNQRINKSTDRLFTFTLHFSLLSYIFTPMHIAIAIQAAVDASTAIMKVYHRRGFATDHKADGSPVTIADKQADAIIRKHLQPTGIPVISEESKLLPYETRKRWPILWMVDPLDGTKEFIKHNGEFTVNIALVENGTPVMGVITAPVTGKGWVGIPGKGIYSIDNIYDTSLAADPEQFPEYLNSINPATGRAPGDNTLRMAMSRSHPDQHTEDLISHLINTGTNVARVPRGSSLKLCEIAMGRADVYPRFGPTMEWDIAAGQAIMQAAGGHVVDMQTGKPLVYNKPDMLNPYFVAGNGNTPKETLAMIRQWHCNQQE